MTKISIIIATYNAERTIKYALESVAQLNFKDWECLVVDGKSKDNTIGIVKEYAERDSRFRYISEPDKGIYDAFNKGWKLAKGEWIYYLGADDKVTSDGLNKLIEQSADYEIISGSVCLLDEKGNKKLQASKGYDGCHQAKIMKRNLLSEFQGFDCKYRILADKELFVRMRNQNIPIKNIDAPIAYFALGGVSQRYSTIIQKTKENFSLYKTDSEVKYPFLAAARIFLYYNTLWLKSLIR